MADDSARRKGLGRGLSALLGDNVEAGPAAAAQHQAQARLQVLDVAADRRGADVEFQLGRRHAAALHHAAKDLEQAQVHVVELAQHGARLYFHRSSTEV